MLRSLWTKERPERFIQDALNKRATVSNSLTSLFKKEWMRDSLKKQVNRTFALSLSKNELFARKTDDQIPNPGTSRTPSIWQEGYQLESHQAISLVCSQTLSINQQVQNKCICCITNEKITLTLLYLDSTLSMHDGGAGGGVMDSATDCWGCASGFESGISRSEKPP